MKPSLLNQFESFTEYCDAKQFSINLRKMLFAYLRTNSGKEDVFINDLLFELDGLFDLLQAIEESK